MGVSKGNKGINHQILLKNLIVYPKAALRTVNRITQQGIRKVFHP